MFKSLTFSGLPKVVLFVPVFLTVLLSCSSTSTSVAMDPLENSNGFGVGVGTIFLPEDFKKLDASYLDEPKYVEFEGDSFKIFVEWGDDVSTPAGRASEVERESGQIHSHPVELYYFSEASEGNLPGESLGNWKVMHIVRNVSELEISIWITYSNDGEAEKAERILKSFSIK